MNVWFEIETKDGKLDREALAVKTVKDNSKGLKIKWKQHTTLR